MTNTGRGLGRNEKGMAPRSRKKPASGPEGSADEQIAAIDRALSDATRQLCDPSAEEVDERRIRTLIALRSHYSKVKDEPGDPSEVSGEERERFRDLVDS